MADKVFTFKTSGLSETVAEINNLANAQKSLEKFLKDATAAFVAEGESVDQAKIKAQQFAQQNNITAQSFLQLSEATRQAVEQQKQADTATKQYQASVKETEKAVSQLANSLKGSQSAIDNVKNAFNGNVVSANNAVNAYKSLSAAGASASDIQNQLSSRLGVTASQFKALNDSLEGSSEHLTGFSSVLSGIGEGVGIRLEQTLEKIVEKVVELGIEAVQTSIKFDQVQRSLNAVSGGVLEGAQNFQFIKKESNDTGVSIDKLGDAYVRLAAASRNTTLEGEKTREVFDAVTKTGVVLGSTSAQTEQALTALEQMLSKGTVSAQELKLQLGNALPGSFEVAARAMGLTTQELTKLVSTGNLAATDFIPKFAAQLKKEFGSQFAESLNSPAVAIGALENKFTGLEQKFGEELLPALQELFKLISDNSDNLEEFVAVVGKATGETLELFVGVLKEASNENTLLGSTVHELIEQLRSLQDVISIIEAVGSKLSLLSQSTDKPIISIGNLQIKLSDFGKAAADFINGPGKLLSDFFRDTAAVLDQPNLDKLNQSLDDNNKQVDKNLSANKLLIDQYKDQKQLTEQQISGIKDRIKANEDLGNSLNKQLKDAEALPTADEKQRIAKEANIASIKNQITALSDQNQTLRSYINTSNSASTETNKSKQAVKDETEEIKRKTQALKDEQQAQRSAAEAVIKSQEDREKAAAKAAEQKQENEIKSEETKAENELKAQGERELRTIKEQNENAINDKKASFERDVIAPLKLENEQDIQNRTRSFETEQQNQKAAFENQLRQQEKAILAERQKRDQEQAREFSRAENLLEQESATDQKQLEKLQKEQAVADALDKIDLGKKLNGQQILDLAKQLTGVTDLTVKENAEVVKNAITQIENAQKEQLKAKDQAADEARQEEIRAKQKEFDDKQKQDKLDFEQNVLQPIKQKNEEILKEKQIEFERTVLQPFKDKLEDQLNAKKAANEEKIQKLKESYQDKIDNLKAAYEEKERERDLAFQLAKIDRDRKYKADERKLDIDAQEQIEALKNKNKTETPNQPVTKPSGRFRGGNVQQNQAYIVGEYEPELFVPNATGTILNQWQAYQNIRLLEQVGKTKFNQNVNSEGYPINNVFDSLLAETRLLKETIASKESSITVPVKFESTDKGYQQYTEFMKVQRSIIRAII